MLLPTYVVFMTSRGLSLAEVALATTVQGVVVLVLELPTGGLADAIGRRPVLVLAATLAVLSEALMLAGHGVGVFALAWGLNGIFRALDSGPLEAWYVDAALAADPDRDLTTDLAGAGTVIYAAVATGALIAGAGTFVPGLPIDPLTLAVAVAVALEVVHLGAVLLYVHEVRPPRGRAEAFRAAAATPAVIRDALGVARRSRALRLVLAVELTWGAGLAAVELLWQPRLAGLVEGSGDTLALGLTGASGWVAGAAGAALLPLLVRRLHGSTTLAAAVLRVAQGVAVAMFAVPAGIPGVVAAYAGFYLIHGAANPAHYALLHRLVTGAHRTTVLSVNSLVSRLGALPAGLAFGVLADAGRTDLGFAIAALLLASAAPLYLRAGADAGPPNPDDSTV